MEINSSYPNVQTDYAVQTQKRSSRGQDVEFISDSNGAAFVAVTTTQSEAQIQTETSPSINSSGQEVGNFVNTWA